MNISIASVAFSALDAVFQSKFTPFSSAYAFSVVAFIATPRLSIMVKLPFAAPAIDSIALAVSSPMTEATSAALCIACVVMSSACFCSRPDPWNSDPILFAVAMYSLADMPMFLYAVVAMFWTFFAY